MLTLLLAFAVAPPPRPATDAGDRLLAASMRIQAEALREKALLDVKDRAAWDAVKGQRRRELFQMMGLDPLPPRSPLRATVTGTIVTPTYRVEKLHFQSVPGLYVTANLYLPLKQAQPAPAILYVCGHGPSPGGNKATYQHHGAWFAENGYVCLMLDTLQLGEIPGLHHGTSRFNMWWWQSLGYTPAGIELWNGIRGLDYLETRPEVDRARLGVTGRSGGGATSWWVMAADDRVKCGVPVAGLADMIAHVSEGYPGRLANGVIGGHCDCMYFVNTHRWDFIQVMALCAPRPLLLGNTDQDAIFPVPGYRRPAEPIEKLYESYGAGDRFGLLETKGPHKDTPELRQGAFKWLNRWLKGDAGEVTMPDRPRHDPKDLKAVQTSPVDAINDIVHERFIRPARHDIPESPAVTREWWKGKSAELTASLRERVFGGWPRDPGPLNVTKTEKTVHGMKLTAIDFDSEPGVRLRAWVLSVGEPKEWLVTVADEAEWARWVADLEKPERLATMRRAMEAYGWAYVLVAPRGVGPTRWSDREPHQVRRRYALLGQTLEGMQAWDVRRAVATLKGNVALIAEGDMAAVALYAGLFEPAVKRLELRRLTPTHRSGPAFLNVLTVLDVPQAVALVAGREVTLTGDPKAWAWLLEWQRKIGATGLKVQPGE